MKTRSIVSSAIFVAVSLLLNAPATTTADTGGGSGRPMTPYPRDHAPTVDEIKQAWQNAAGAMRVEGVSVQGSNASRSGYKVGFAYVKNDDAIPAPAFELAGLNERGGKESISLANLASITLVSIERKLVGANEAIIEVEQFPAVDPAELFAAQPSYSELKSRHTRKVRLRLPTSNADGDFAMVGTGRSGDAKYRILFRVDELAPAVLVPIRSDREKGLWWAIPSVIADPAYPYRLVMKN